MPPQETLTIKEVSASAEGFQVSLNFNHQGEEGVYPTISPPFNEQEEQRLRWYFEHWLNFPFTQEVRAEQAAASITRYGESLFQQLSSDHEVYAQLANHRRQAYKNLRIDIVGSPDFQALHWESLKDPKFPTPIDLNSPHGSPPPTASADPRNVQQTIK